MGLKEGRDLKKDLSWSLLKGYLGGTGTGSELASEAGEAAVKRACVNSIRAHERNSMIASSINVANRMIRYEILRNDTARQKAMHMGYRHRTYLLDLRCCRCSRYPNFSAAKNVFAMSIHALDDRQPET